MTTVGIPIIPQVNGALLNRVVYNPAVDPAYVASSPSLTVVDATNLAVTFTVPLSGNVDITVEGTFNTAANADHMLFGVHLNGVTNPIYVDAGSGAANGQGIRGVVTIPCTGLQPVATVVAALLFAAVAGTATLHAGGGAAPNGVGPILLSVISR
jgi:hypothetical protein